MPDIDPAALSRPPIISTTPILPPKSISSSVPSAPKISKAQHIPARIDLEPLYTALKIAIGEHWGTYKESFSLFVVGQLNQTELSARIDNFLITPSGEIEHLHNQLIAAIYGNVTREMPDQGVASWVSANDKPTTGAGSKPVSGDAAEQRLKIELKQLPARDRRRLKDLSQNDPVEVSTIPEIFSEIRRAKVPKAPESIPPSAGGLNKTNWDVEIRKRYTMPLASESGEFPDASTIESRMLPICYEKGLVSGHVSDAAHFMSVATETFIKEVLSEVFKTTCSNGPGSSGSASWIQTHAYRCQLEKEEEAYLRGDIQRDKNGLLPIEAKAASERGPLGMADLRTALELKDCNLGSMPVITHQIMFGYREGELEAWDDYSWPVNHTPGQVLGETQDEDIEMGGVNGTNGTNGINGINGHVDDTSSDDWGWEGVDDEDRHSLDNVLDSCLAIGS